MAKNGGKGMKHFQLLYLPALIAFYVTIANVDEGLNGFFQAQAMHINTNIHQ